jgi:hypothetical protein
VQHVAAADDFSVTSLSPFSKSNGAGRSVPLNSEGAHTQQLRRFVFSSCKFLNKIQHSTLTFVSALFSFPAIFSI